MAQRLSEQVVEWLTVGGDAFTPQNFNSTNGNIPLVVSKPGESVTIPATNGTAIGIYNNKGQLWTLGAAAASTSVKSSQLIVSSSDSGNGSGVGIELWRGSYTSWQLLGSNGTDSIFYIGNNSATTNKATYDSNIALGYGAPANQYVHIYSTLDSNYAHSVGGAALSVMGGITAAKKIYFADTTDSNYATKAGALVVEGGVNIAKKVYLRDTTDSNYATVAGSFVTMGGAYIKKKTYIADVTDSNYATKAGSLVTEGGAYIAKKTYIASTVDSNYSTKAGSLVTEGGIYSAKKVYIADATDSNYSTLAGALVVAGGANFGKKVYLKDATDSTSYTTGSLVTAGGAAITKQLRVQGVTTHGGDVVSDTDNTDNLGTNSVRWKQGYFNTAGLLIGAKDKAITATDSSVAAITNTAITLNHQTKNSAYGYFLKGQNVQYARWYIDTMGTANTPAAEEGGTGTAGTLGFVLLEIGNSTAVNTNTAYGSTVSGANNAKGGLTLYANNTKYTRIYPHSDVTGHQVLYLPKLITSGTSTYYGKLVGIYKSTSSGDSGFSDVGSTTQPVYVTADGKVITTSYALKATLNNATQWGVAYYSTTTNVTSTAAGTAGYPLIGAGSAAPAWYDGTVFTGSAAASYKTEIKGTTDTSSSTTGALVVSGGVGIAKKLYVANTITLGGTTSSTAQIIFSRTGSLNYIMAPADASIAFCTAASATQASSAAIVNSTALIPGAANTFNLGSSSATWKNMFYAGTIYFGTSSMDRAILAFSSDYPKYGIWYKDASTDTMRFSASNNADTDAGADICINGGGAGTVSFRGYSIQAVSGTYGTLEMATAKGSYYGITSGPGNDYLTLMSHTGKQHQGLYNTAKGKWVFYYDATNNRATIGSSTTTSGYFLTVNGGLYCDNTIRAGGGHIWAGVTTASAEKDCGAAALAGTIYLYSGGSATGERGIYGVNNAGTGGYVFSVNQSNQINRFATIACAVTITGTLTLSKTQDASGSANNSPALIIGGAATAQHIEIDGNEILSKSNGTTPSTLYLQDGGTISLAGVLQSNTTNYGGSLPTSGLSTGRIFFKTV